MGFGFAAADVEFLRSAAGREALADAADLALIDASMLRDLTVLRTSLGDRAAAVAETVRLRRRAVAKLHGSAQWLFTDDALQQATPTLVARHRARRLAGRTVHDVTCSIGADLAELVGQCPLVVGSDLDPVRLLMCAYNVASAHLLRADALTPTTRDTVVVADPARRRGGGRTHNPARLQPPLPDLLDAYRGRDLVVKCSPGLDTDRLDWAGEVEVVSLDGAVREACLWSPGLTDGVRRRATVLSAGAPAWTVTDADPHDLPERELGRWIVDPDGAVVRSGLVRHYAARHGLWQLDPRIAYLTGDVVPPGVRGFEILARHKLDEKAIRRELLGRNGGALEILVRGVDIDPDRLRAQLKLRGSVAHTLVVTRIGRAAVVFVCGAGVAT